jgi:hypothetical protein
LAHGGRVAGNPIFRQASHDQSSELAPMNWAFLKEPINWLVVWTMLVIGWFLFRTIQRNLPSGNN